MGITEDNSAGSLIESAMERLGGVWRDSEDDRPRKGTERALQHRLQQLQTVLGEDGAQPGMPPAAIVPAAPLAAKPSPALYRPATLLVVAVVSAVIGAGAMRWTMAAGEAAPPAMPALEAPVVALPAVPQVSPEQEARALVEHWRQGWSDQNLDAYLASYGADFVPANGLSRLQWEAARRKAILGKRSISVSIRDLRVRLLTDDRIEVAFLQDYAAGAYREAAQPKTLTLTRQNGRWTIAREARGEASGR